MPGILTSWKEIGQYLGKGVRTVQRWEREADLPVRRQIPPARRAVMAIPEELDEWVRSRTRGPGGTAADSLRRDLTALREETSELTDEMSQLRKRVEFMEANLFGSRTRWNKRGARQGSLREPEPQETDS